MCFSLLLLLVEPSLITISNTLLSLVVFNARVVRDANKIAEHFAFLCIISYIESNVLEDLPRFSHGTTFVQNHDELLAKFGLSLSAQKFLKLLRLEEH
jgi:hypothetical protein